MRVRLVAVLIVVAVSCGTSEDEAARGVAAVEETPAAEPAAIVSEPVADVAAIVPDVGTVPIVDDDPTRGEVEAGDSMSAILRRAGLDATAAARVSIALEPVMDPATIQAGQRYAVELADDGSLVKFTFHRSVTRTVTVAPDEGGIFRATQDEIDTTVRTEAAGGVVESSLWAAMTAQGHEPALVDTVVDAFAWDIDFFTSTRKGDEFRVLVERHEVDGEFVRYGRVLAGQYLGESANAQIYWWGDGDDGRHVDEQGRGVQRTLLKTPLKYARISSGFDPARIHPVLHKVKSHRGVDYAAPEGTPVWAAADGKIVYRDHQRGAGNMVILGHAGGLTTLYMHLSRFHKGQSVGQSVRAKTVIGYVGATGLATGPHLHFGVKKNGKYVDPQRVESTRGPGVPKAKRAAFERQRDEAIRKLEAIAMTE